MTGITGFKVVIRSLQEKNRSLQDKNRSLQDKNRSLEDKNLSLEDKNLSLEEFILELSETEFNLKKELEAMKKAESSESNSPGRIVEVSTDIVAPVQDRFEKNSILCDVQLSDKATATEITLALIKHRLESTVDDVAPFVKKFVKIMDTSMNDPSNETYDKSIKLIKESCNAFVLQMLDEINKKIKEEKEKEGTTSSSFSCIPKTVDVQNNRKMSIEQARRLNSLANSSESGSSGDGSPWRHASASTSQSPQEAATPTNATPSVKERVKFYESRQQNL